MRVKDAVNSTHSEGSSALRSRPRTLPAIAERCDPNRISGHAAQLHATSTVASSRPARAVQASQPVQHPILPRTRSLHSARNPVDTDSLQHSEGRMRRLARAPEDGLREYWGTGTRRSCAFRRRVVPVSTGPGIRRCGNRAVAPGRGKLLRSLRTRRVETAHGEDEPLAG